MDVEKEIKTAIKEKKLIIGEKSVFRVLKQNLVKSVFYASNCPEDKSNTLKYYNKQLGIDVQRFKGDSRQLGEICAKPFNISILGVKK